MGDFLPFPTDENTNSSGGRRHNEGYDNVLVGNVKMFTCPAATVDPDVERHHAQSKDS